jgi:putative ABC transport system permease protein
MPRGWLLLLLVLIALLATLRPAAQDKGAAGEGSAHPASILISRQLAEHTGLQAGDLVHLAADPSGTNQRAFHIAGVYEPTPDPMRINAPKHEARFHLPDLLAMTADPRDPLASENAGAISLAVSPGADAGRVSSELMARVPGIVAQPASAATRAGTFVVLERFHMAIAIVTILASTVFLLALTIMLVDERRESVGILRLIGLRSPRILLQLFVEGALIAVAGALFGLLLAAASEIAINRYFQWHYDTALVFVRITPDVALRSALIAVPLGALASVAASWTLLRRRVLEVAKR